MKTSEEWKEEIQSNIPERHQCKIACIIWWMMIPKSKKFTHSFWWEQRLREYTIDKELTVEQITEYLGRLGISKSIIKRVTRGAKRWAIIDERIRNSSAYNIKRQGLRVKAFAAVKGEG